MKLVLYVSFFFFSFKVLARATNNVCRVGFAYRAACSKGYATPDGHVSASRTGIHEDAQGLDRCTRPYKDMCSRSEEGMREGMAVKIRKFVKNRFQVRECTRDTLFDTFFS